MGGKEVVLKYVISKRSLDLVKAGQVVISSGGVRDLQGRLVELAKPIGMIKNKIPGSLLSGGNLISSLAGNVQCAYIQKSVNKIDRKMDIVLDNLSCMDRKMDISNKLGFANVAASFINCAISIVGFSKVLKRLNVIDEKLTELSNIINTEIVFEKVELFRRYSSYLSSDIGILQDFNLSDASINNIENHLNEIEAYIQRLIIEYEYGKMDSEIVCNIIYPLSAAFSQVVREYVAQYYYLKKKRPNNYSMWVNTLLSICDDSFTQKIRLYLLNVLEGTMVDKMKLVNSMINNSIEAVENIEYTKYLIEKIDYYEYKNFDELVMYKCREGQFSYEREYALIDITA